MDNDSLNRLSFDEIVNLDVNDRITYYSEVTYSIFFNHIKSALNTILDYSAPFLKAHDFTLVYDVLTRKLDFTKQLGNKPEEDHYFILTTLEMAFQEFLINRVINQRWSYYESQALSLRGAEAEAEAATLLQLITKLKIATRGLDERDKSFGREYIRLHSIISRTNKRPTEIDYFLLINILKTSMCFDIFTRYQGLFEGLNTFRGFSKLVEEEKSNDEGLNTPLTLRQQALFLIYRKVRVTSINVGNFLPEGRISKSKLLQFYNEYSENRARTGECVSNRTYKSRIRDFERILKELDGEDKQRAESEFQQLMRNNDNWK